MISCRLYWIVVLLQALALCCKPGIDFNSASPNPELDGQMRIDCDVTLCDPRYQLRWRKWTFKPNGEKDKHIDLYYYNNDSDNGALDGTFDYDIKDRTTYGHVFGLHTLIINDLIIKDNGTWECVATIPSDGLDVIIPVKPTPGNITILPTDPPIVEGQTVQFQCVVNGVNPVPSIKWIVGAVENTDGEILRIIVNDYWSVTNIIKLDFPNTGDVEVNCTLGRGSDYWGSRIETIEVKDKASINNPSDDSERNFTAAVELAVEATGYKPTLQWKFEGSKIENGQVYNIETTRNNVSATSTLKSRQQSAPYTCDNITRYTGTYTCEATLEPPYNHSSDLSPDTKVTILYSPILERPSYNEISTRKGKEIELHCLVCANPPPSYAWSHRSQLIPLVEKTLKITVTAETIGVYYCTASNHLGNANVYFVVVLEDEGVCLTVGAMVGIVFGVLAAVLIPIGVTAFVLYKKKIKYARGQVIQNAYVNGSPESSHEESGNQGEIIDSQDKIQASEEYSDLNRTGLYNNGNVNVYDVLQPTS